MFTHSFGNPSQLLKPEVIYFFHLAVQGFQFRNVKISGTRYDHDEQKRSHRERSPQNN